MTADIHCHFFSSRFLELLTRDLPELPDRDRAAAVAARLGWEPPGTPEALADRWVHELDRHGVDRAAIMASLPGDAESVRIAVGRHPARLVGSFMCNPVAAGAVDALGDRLGDGLLRIVALFPAMHGYALDAPQVESVFAAASAHGAAVFVHCGVLSVGVRAKLGLPSAFDLRRGDPLAAAALAARYPAVPVIIPHFGAGFFREALMALAQSPNVCLDTSSSNGWMKYHPGLTLEQVFRQALDVGGPARLIFGTDSSFFPRGWQAPIRDAQVEAMTAAGADAASQGLVLGGNFNRLFPVR
jgi:predicted TIM-barrel fold metal-dependent hydrolase